MNGIEFSFGRFPVCYNHHQVSEVDFNFIFPDGVVANVLAYKKLEEIKDETAEFTEAVKMLGLKNGYLVFIPYREGDKIIVRAV